MEELTNFEMEHEDRELDIMPVKQLNVMPINWDRTYDDEMENDADVLYVYKDISNIESFVYNVMIFFLLMLLALSYFGLL